MVENAPEPKRLKSESMIDEHETKGPEVTKRVEMGAKSSLREGAKESKPLGSRVIGRLGEKLKPIKAIMVGCPEGIKKEESKFKSGESQEEKAVSSPTDPTSNTKIIS